MNQLNRNDPRYAVILDHTRNMVKKRFNIIPGVLFEKCMNNDTMQDEVLTLVGSNGRECPICNEEVDKDEEIKCICKSTFDIHEPDPGQCECTCILDPEDDEYNGKHHWQCSSCNNESIIAECAYEDLSLSGPRYGGWPAAHGTVFWTTDWPHPVNMPDLEISSPGIVAAAEEAGFLVYEPADFDGHILAIDGGGYDFYEAHWVPLYLALGLKWHEQDERWQQACIDKRNHDRQRLNVSP